MKERITPPNPSGLCICGCGQITNRAKRDDVRYAHAKGEHVRFIHGHRRHPQAPSYIVNEETGCWESQLCSGDGYGNHRAYYEAYVGPIPVGMDIDHLCRNRSCVNPEHLEPVTRGENIRRGLLAKLTHADVGEIRARVARGDRTTDIAADFGVSKTNISCIKYGRSWATP